MLSATATLIAAIKMGVRVPLLRADIDWGTVYDDVSQRVDSFNLNSNITSDIPPEANILTGPAATEVRLGLSGLFGGSIKPTQLVSPYGGWLSGAERVNIPLDVDLGFRTSAGDEYLNQFVGRVRSVVSNDDGTATVTSLDGPELLRENITLPTFAAVDPVPATNTSPGLDAGWVMDFILRRNGYWQRVPPRADTRACMTMRNSTYPEVGNWQPSNYGIPSGKPKQGAPLFLERTGGKVLSWHTSSTPLIGADLTAGLSVTPGSSLMMEFGHFDADQQSVAYVGNAGYPNGTSFVSLLVDITHPLGTKDFLVLISRGGASQYVNIGPVDGLVSGTYCALHVTWTSTGADLRLRYNGTTYTGTATVGNSGSGDLLSELRIPDTATGGYNSMELGDVSITGEAYNANMWSDGLTPNAYLDFSLNPLVVTPNVEERDAWNVLQEVVQAENGVILFDETGIVRFYNRETLAAQTTAVATITSTTSLKTLNADEAVDTVRNIIRVPANPYKLDLVTSWVWELQEVMLVPELSSINIAADVEGVLIAADTSMTYFSAGYTAAGTGSGYRAARNQDGTGGDVSNLSFSVTHKPSRMVIRVTNPNPYAVWLVGNSLGEAGTPLLKIAGRLARLGEFQYRYSARDEDSINKYGEQTVELQENPFRQSAATAEELATALLAQLKDPHPFIRDLSVVGDPRIQLTDRVTLVEQTYFMYARDYRVVGKTVDWTPEAGLSMRMSLRELGPATTGMTGQFTLDDSVAGQLDSVYGLA